MQALFGVQVFLGRLIAIRGSMDSLGTYLGVDACLEHYGIYIHKTTMTPLSTNVGPNNAKTWVARISYFAMHGHSQQW